MTVANRFTKQLTAPAKDRPVLDAVLSTVEAGADILTKDDLISAVPFVSTAFKVVKALDSTRDRLFAAKLQAFIAEVESLTHAERDQLAHKLTADDEGRKAGETLLLVLDKLTDMDKPALLGALLVHFGRGDITATELRRLASAVDLAFGDDLAMFLDEPLQTFSLKSMAAHREALVPTGLIRMYSGPTIGAIGVLEFGPTDLGIKLHALMHIWGKAQAE